MSQELYSEDRWRWATSGLESAAALLEETLGREVSELDKVPHLHDPQDYAEAFYYRVEEPGSVLRAGLFCQAAAVFEYTLFFLCLEAAHFRNAKAPDAQPRSIVITRLRFLKEMTAQDYPSRAGEIVVLIRLRNLLLHSNGEEHGLPEERDEAIAGWIARHPELTTESAGAIRLTAGFFPHCFAVFDSMIRDIINDLKRRESPPVKPAEATG